MVSLDKALESCHLPLLRRTTCRRSVVFLDWTSSTLIKCGESFVVIRSDFFELTLLIGDLGLDCRSDWVVVFNCANSTYTTIVVILGWEHDVVRIQRHLRG